MRENWVLLRGGPHDGRIVNLPGFAKAEENPDDCVWSTSQYRPTDEWGIWEGKWVRVYEYVRTVMSEGQELYPGGPQAGRAGDGKEGI